MSKLVFTRTELLSEHDYASRQTEAGYRLHGGFDEEGRYISPRSLVRGPALRAWQAELAARGESLLDAGTDLLSRAHYPSFQQQVLLLRNGAGRTLWDSLTVTGIVEARGLALVNLRAPDFNESIVEPLTATCTGHLNKGLLEAHGYDEGGNHAAGQGGHDDMWYAVRDLLFGTDAYQLPAVPAAIGRPESKRLMPQIPARHEDFILLLMNVLMIEVRAEAFFEFCCRIARCPQVFADRRAEADHAAELVERIRKDEQIHIGYLQTVLSELRSFQFKLADGTRTLGATFLDPVWKGMIAWHGGTQFDLAREQTRQAIGRALSQSERGRSILAELDALEGEESAA